MQPIVRRYPKHYLSSADCEEAKKVARLRVADAQRYCKVDYTADAGRTLDYHTQGALAELAFARWSGLPWTGRLFNVDQWKTRALRPRDVEPFEVRSRPMRGKDLPARPHDDDGAIYVLCWTHRLPMVGFVGWAYGREIKQHRLNTSKVPAHYMPWRTTHSFDDEPVRSIIRGATARVAL